MSITHITSVSQLNKITAADKNKVSVIDFHASWCGPCHTIAPTFEALSKQYKNVNFLKCDVDAAQDVASMFSVSAMPTFIFLKGSSKVDMVRGADKSGLEAAVRRHASGSPASNGAATFSGKGQTLGGPTAGGGVELPNLSSGITNLDPQMKIFLGLIALYLVFWYLT